MSLAISIHALREEGDRAEQAHRAEHRISIHALREEGDEHHAESRTNLGNFYPRPPRGGRQLTKDGVIAAVKISIHALREEGDTKRPGSSKTRRNFYPRPPRGGRLKQVVHWVTVHKISIHALREEGDMGLRPEIFLLWHFYPRPPRGGRPTTSGMDASRTRFLSTPSARRATGNPNKSRGDKNISIHALREEGDSTSRPR